eukprot:CAMPEP_0117085894 /NCGR_PEP_ID=MMETSP0472-20121206/60334_1 /TAXON_ID=693140 ORGANISM="Tiarina fusus, Strain LIS" /NCGR_SAMPLE_ID=MMETSP0472 /ASSEMBLY_ACC=CAM_ASM_000603 /LENGTH=572 /DNA_ID=CAMNT_0004815239 /DNA_START=1 /DNA_END=1716 /DNA_ORIENTATION=+
MSGWFGFGKTETKVYRERDLRAHIKSGMIRLNLRKNKATAAVQKARRDISNLLTNGNDEKARIIAEQALKDENLTSAFEELQAITEEVLARIGIITANKRLPIDLKEPICTLIWASARIDIKEFGLIREQFALRFGANLDHEALCNIENCVSELVRNLLNPMPPEEETVFAYLKNVAIEFNIDWGFDEDLEVPEASLQDIYGFSVDDNLSGLETGEPVNDTESNPSGLSIDDFPDIASSNKSAVGSQISDLDDLESFEQMFAPIPNSGSDVNVGRSVLSPSLPLGLQPAVVQKVVPQKISQNVQQIQPQSPSPVVVQRKQTSPAVSNVKKVSSTLETLGNMELKRQMSKELAQMSEKDLEAEFEQLFNCSFDSNIEPSSPVAQKKTSSSSISLVKQEEIEPENPRVSEIQLSKIPPKTNELDSESEFVVEHVSTAGSSEYDDLFSAPAPMADAPVESEVLTPTPATAVDIFPTEWNIPSQEKKKELDDYDDIFARLSSVSVSETNSTENWNASIKDAETGIQELEMTNDEWAARFNSPQTSTFDFTDTEPEKTQSEPDKQPDLDDDLMRRFM